MRKSKLDLLKVCFVALLLVSACTAFAISIHMPLPPASAVAVPVRMPLPPASA